MNILVTANSGLGIIHDTDHEVHTASQIKAAPRCTRRKIYCFVLEAGSEKMNCPKCAALR